ncbi:MAG: phage terminase large subunit, partial [Clostridia bacterium]|nr:phage terminase large subunit [Clostridia bacterium]
MDLRLTITPRQLQFIDAEADEVLYGGAAGGGKSYGQVVDSLLFGLKYPRSKQLILRRTLGELEKSILRIAADLIPQTLGKYNRAEHIICLANGSIIDFGYCAREDDVRQYQSAEYDVIRFDELTHFTEFQYTYMLSRIRGSNGYPKRMKSSTNPGGV